jgi:hypothetical protein
MLQLHPLFSVGGNKLPNVSEESGYRSPNPWPENLSQTLLKKLPSGGQSSMDAQSSTSNSGANNKTKSEGHFIHTTSSVRQVIFDLFVIPFSFYIKK